VYEAGGWGVYGGTSAAAPIVASIYALAGTPAAGSNPASYPYSYASYLNDVVSGTNGTCSVAVLCTAGTGWDGPTGLGTPNGTGAFSATGQNLTRGQTATGGTPAPVTTAPAPTPPVTTAPVTSPVTTAPVTAAPTSAPPAPVTTAPVTTTPVGPSCGGQWVLNSTFAGSRGWSASAGVLRRGSARLDGYGRRHTDRLSQAVSLRAGCPAALRFTVSIAGTDHRANADRLSVTVNGRLIWQATNRTRSATVTVNLSRYAGQRIVLTFTGVENASLATAFTVRQVSITG
jgi:hypothetical protein